MSDNLTYKEKRLKEYGSAQEQLNFITKIPTVILDDIKKYYQKYIEDCFKKQNLVINKNKHTDKHKDTHKGKKKTYKKTSYTKKTYKKK